MMTYIVLGFLAAVAAWIVYGAVKAKKKEKLDESFSYAPPAMDNVPVVPPSNVAVVQDPPVKTEDPALVTTQPLDYVADKAVTEKAKKKAPRRKGSVATKSKK